MSDPTPPEGGLSVLLVLASSGWGGTERAVVDLARWLSTSCEVTLALPRDATFLGRVPDGVEVVALPRGSRRNPLTIRRVAHLIREVAPDVVHSHAAKAAEMVHWAGLLERRPHVATKHNTRARGVFGRIRHVTAVSEQARRSVRSRWPVDVVYDGVEDESPTGPVAKPERFTVIGVGRLHRHKAFDRLVRAIAALPFDCALRLAGEGPERGALERLARELGAERRVTLLGHREDVPELLASSHVQVVSSSTEGFSLALVEGLMACDVVLSTPVGIAPELLPTELLVEPDRIGAALEAVHAAYDRYRDLTHRARARASGRFAPERVVEAYRAVYIRAIGHVSVSARGASR